MRSRLDWKYLLGLEVRDAGFHSSVLCEFRSRLLTGEAEHRLFEGLLTHFKARGWLTQRQRQRTDSTHILAAVRSLNRLELVGRTLQHALHTLALVSPDWLLTQIDPECFERYSRPLDEYRLPKEKAERLALAEQIGKDGQYLLLRVVQSQSVLVRLQVESLIKIMFSSLWLMLVHRIGPGADGNGHQPQNSVAIDILDTFTRRHYDRTLATGISPPFH